MTLEDKRVLLFMRWKTQDRQAQDTMQELLRVDAEIKRLKANPPGAVITERDME